MEQPYPDALTVSRKVLKGLVVLNWLFGAGILVLLIASLIAGEWVARALGAYHEGGNTSLIMGMREIMVIGIVATPIAYLIFSRLLAIVDTVRGGDPFVAENASRLQTIAWAVLGLQIMNLVVAFIAARVSSGGHPLHIDCTRAVTPWLAVLLLFVLARVFDHGARMREDLQGTI